METTNYRKLIVVSAILHVLIQFFIYTGFDLAYSAILDSNVSRDRFLFANWLGIIDISAFIVGYVALFFILKA